MSHDHTKRLLREICRFQRFSFRHHHKFVIIGLFCSIWIDLPLDIRLHTNEFKEISFDFPGSELQCSDNSSLTANSKRIVYIESSGEECLTPRQACGIESAARVNPDMSIEIHTNSVRMGRPGWDYRMRRPGRIRSCVFNKLVEDKYPNVKFIRQDFTHLLNEEPAFRRHVDRMKRSPFWVVQLSDAVRLILLKRNGGFYLDFDNIVFRPLSCLRNTLSYLEEAIHIENGIMVMDRGHPFLNFLLRYIGQVYNPTDRLSLGPPAFGRAFQLFCQTQEPHLQAGTHRCHNNSTVTLIHPDAFFPVKHTQSGFFYSVNLKDFDYHPMENAYMTHVYLSSWGTTVHPSSLYARLARKFCPDVWQLTKHEDVAIEF